MDIIGLNLGHDSGLAHISEDSLRVLEFERSLSIKHVCGGNKKTYDLYKNYVNNKNISYLGVSDYFSRNCKWLPFEKGIYRTTLNHPIVQIEFSKNFNKRESDNTKIFLVKHHLAHASSSYFTSNFSDSLIITVDGFSENGETCSVSLGKGNSIEMKEIFDIYNGPRFGAVYESFAKKIFGSQFDTGKLMGLSAYGNEIPGLLDIFRLMMLPNNIRRKVGLQEISLPNNILVSINDKFHKFDDNSGSHLETSKLSKEEFEEKIFTEVFDSIIIGGNQYNFSYDYRNSLTVDLSKTLQKAFEEEIVLFITHMVKKYESQNLCLAGGCFLNVISNSILKKEISNIYIPPFCSDTGISIGSALAIKHIFLNKDRNIIDNLVYSGEDLNFNEERIDKSLEIKKYNSINDLYLAALRKIKTGKAIGWVNSSYELGPRALGNRSILASSSIHGMKDYINKEVKFRESFRPLAPILLDKEVKNYFNETNWLSEYMLLNFTANEITTEKYSEILHVDGTSRIQSVSKSSNKRMYDFLQLCLEELSLPMLFNTSLNIKGKPILNNTSDINYLLNDTKLDSIFLIDHNISVERKNCNE